MYRKYKYEGYTAYWRLKEQSAKADLHRITLQNETQMQIFQMNIDVNQDVIDFLINLLLQLGEMNAEQWENHQTIYLDKFVRQFKKLWYDRGKSIPDLEGNYFEYKQKRDNTVSRTGKSNNRIEYNLNNKIQEDGAPLFGLDMKKSFFGLRVEMVMVIIVLVIII